MASLNKVQLIGFTGGEPRITTYDGGGKSAQFSLATTERAYTAKSGAQIPERTEWHNIVLYNGLADVAERYIHKGSLIYVEGKLKTRSYEKQGATHYITEVIVDSLQMLSKQEPKQPEQSSGGAF